VTAAKFFLTQKTPAVDSFIILVYFRYIFVIQLIYYNILYLKNLYLCLGNRFDIIERDNTVVTGTVRLPTSIESEKISANLGKYVDDEEEMNSKDIYKELRLRGYQYTGEFRGLKSASATGSNGYITWTSNWVTFMDNMLQLLILGKNTRNLLVPTRIRKLVIDPKYHIQLIQDDPIENKSM